MVFNNSAVNIVFTNQFVLRVSFFSTTQDYLITFYFANIHYRYFLKIFNLCSYIKCQSQLIIQLKNNYILTCIDTLSRWVEAIPIPDRSADTVAKAIFEQVFCRHAFPRELVCDQGSEFINDFMEELCHLTEIKQIPISYN